MRRLTKSEVVNRIGVFGWVWVSGEYKDRRSLLMIQCPNNHILKRNLSKLIRDGGRCYRCRKNDYGINKIKKANQVSNAKGGVCLSDKYLGSTKKYLWQCSKKHTWLATYGSVVMMKSWCPKCCGNLPNTLCDAKDIAHSNGGLCLSDKYINVKSHMKWKCKCGYIWESSLDNIKNNKTWCPKCNGGNYIDLDFVHEYIGTKSGNCLSSEYKNIRSPMKFECNNGHVWETSFESIYKYQSWCPVCNRTKGKSQRKLFDILCSIYEQNIIKYNFRGFDWLKTSKYGKQEIDLWVPHLKLAIEYDGEQHFKPMRFGSKQEMYEKLKLTQSRDKLKNKKIKQHPEDVMYFVRINYTEKLTEKNIVGILISYGVPIV